MLADLYLRLSDLRKEEALDGREAKLRAEATRLGWDVAAVIVENDIDPATGKIKPASAWKRRKVTTPGGRTKLRVIRPGFRRVLDDLMAGVAHAVLAEDLDRACRDPRDLEDLIDACRERAASARSLSGSLTLTEGGTDAEVTMARMMVAVAYKSSADTARRVSAARETLAGKGAYGGGKRPYGFRADPAAPRYAKTLLVVGDEAAVLRRAAADILDRGISLKAIARDLRDRGLPTVSDVPWTPDLVRDVLVKPAIAGFAVHTTRVRDDDAPDGWRTVRTLHKATWPAILEPDRWEALRDKLTDPSRRTSPGNEPRWLVSLYALCGICGDGTTCRVTGGRTGHNRVPSYVCTQRAHLRRNAPALDDYVAGLVIERLSRPDVADMLRPPPRPGTNTRALRAEARKLKDRKQAQARLHAAGVIDDDQLTAGTKEIRDRLAKIESQLAAASEPDPLAEFRDQPAAAVWACLPLARKRAIVKLLMRVTILPATRHGAGFDPERVRVDWLHGH